MAFTNEIVKQSYSGDGTTTSFAIPFTVIVSASAETKVYLRDESVDPATETLQTISTDYTIDADGLNVIFNTAPSADQVVVLVRELPLTQILDLINNGTFIPQSQEETFDRLVAMIQQLDEKISRAPLSQITEQVADSYNYGEPIASTVIGWNSTADQVQLYTFDEITAITDQDLLDHINDPTGAHAASAISNSPSGNLAATTVQAALNELQSNIDLYFSPGSLTGSRVLVTTVGGIITTSSITPTELGYLSGASSNLQTHIDNVENQLGLHVTDTSDAHDASAISVVPSGNLSSTDVQAALLELQVSIDGLTVSPISSTDDLAEGVTNLYFTNERVDDRVAALLVAGTNITLTYNDGANTLTIDASGGGASLAIGSTVTSGTSGSILFVDSSGFLAQDNSALFWEDTNNTLILGDPGSEASSINLNGSSYLSRLKVSDIGGTTPAQFILHRHSSTLPAAIIASRSKSDTSSHTSVAAGDELFFLSASGWTGSHYDTFGIISFSADASGTVSSTSSPGRIDFRVAPDASDSPAIAMSIRQTKSIEMPGYGTGIAHFSSSGVITSSTIVNADVNASAAIAYSKLNLASSIVNADVSGSAAIAYSKLNLATSIVNADISTTAAIGITKIANGTANQLIKANAAATANEFATLSGGTGLSVTFGAGTIALANTGVTSIVAGTGISVSGATGAVTVNSSITQYTDENAQDAVGAMVASSTKVSLTYVDATPSLTADIVAGSLVNADISASAAIAFSKLAALTSGNVLYGVTNVATSTALNTIAVTAITGTANQITASGSVGSVTLSTPQNIHTAATPTFAGMTLSGLSVAGLVHNSAAGLLSTSLLVNADVSASAAIAYSKLNLATSIVNADVSASAAIAYSKLNLASSIVNADISASAAIAFSKLASLSSANILVGNGSNVAAAVAVTGDISLTNAGVTAYNGTVPVNKGGTNITSYTTGDLIYASGAGTLAKRAIGSSGDILTVSGGLPVWAPPAGASLSIGSSITSGTATRVLFEGAGPVLADDASFTYDSTNNILYVPEIAGGSTGSDSFMLSANTATFADTNTGRIQLMERMVWDQSWTATGSAGVLSDALFKFQGTLTTALAINILPAIQDSRIVRYSTSQTVSAFSTFLAGTIYQPTTAVTDLATFTQFSGFVSRPQYAPDIASGTATTDAIIGYSAAPMTRKKNAGTVAVTSLIGFGTYVTSLILSNDLENATITNLYHFKATNPNASTITLTNNIAHYTPALNLGTNRYGYYSDLAANANYFDIYSNGGAQSAHVGLFKFGDNVAPTALVHTLGSTTARASIRVEAGTAPTSPNSGDLWHDSTRQCFQVYCGAMTLGLQKVGFAETGNANINTSTSETTLIGTGTGTATLAANFLTVAKTIKVRMWGFYGTKASPVGALTIRFKYGSTTLVTLSPTLTVSLTNQPFNLEFELTCRTTGATGTVFAQGEGKFYSAAGTAGLISGVTTATTTIDTTASSKIDITAQWATSNASNTITSTNYSMEVLY